MSVADERARQRTALASVAAAVLLVTVKLVTGLVTGSLAFVAEAVHSGTDLIAALLTLFAVRVAIRPPDREHHYGHGKAEHLAALGESAFLIIVSVAIAAESLRRLITGEGHGVDATWWAFVVIAVVIVIDGARTVASRRAAQRFSSPAFAANALHFASDLAGSLAVLVGLILVSAGQQSADAAAALFVAALVVVSALRLARQSVDVLMDRSKVEAEQQIRAALSRLPDPVELRRIRVRHAAGRNFADLVVGVPSDAGVTQAHAIADDVEEVVQESLPGTDVVVHVEPTVSTGDLRERATAAASGVPEVREVHNVRVDAPARRLRAVAAREAAERAVADRGARRGRAAGGPDPRRDPGACARFTRTSSRSPAPTGRSSRRARPPRPSATPSRRSSGR